MMGLYLCILRIYMSTSSSIWFQVKFAFSLSTAFNVFVRFKLEPREQTTTKKHCSANYLDLTTRKWFLGIGKWRCIHNNRPREKPWWFEFFMPTISVWRPEGVSGGSNPRLLIGICCFGEVGSFWSRVFAALGLLLRIPGGGLLGAQQDWKMLEMRLLYNEILFICVQWTVYIYIYIYCVELRTPAMR